MNAADVLNDWLKAIYDTEDNVYKSLIANPEGLMEIHDDGILYYDFSNPENLAEDKSGNGNHGTATDVVGIVEGGRSFGEFNNSTSKLVTDDLTASAKTKGSISFWFKTDTEPVADDGREIISVPETSFGVYLRYTCTWTTQLYIYINTESDTLKEFGISNNGPVGQWNHHLLEFDGNIFRCYINNVLVRGYENTENWKIFNGAIRFGRNLNFALSSLRIYNRTLTDAERTEIYEKNSITHYYKPNNELILKPTDYNIGIIASVLEYLRQSDKEFVLQLYLDKAVGEWLDYIAVEFCGIMRLDGETDTQWVDRIIDIIIGPKLSKAAIIYNTRKFSVDEPVIVNGVDGAFGGVSYGGYFKESFFDSERGRWVMPAIVRNLSSDEFYFRLYLTGTTESDIMNVVSTVDRIKAAGIEYEIRIG